jgi:pimeloyl-ACP methyl ester carboxylesterase
VGPSPEWGSELLVIGQRFVVRPPADATEQPDRAPMVVVWQVGEQRRSFRSAAATLPLSGLKAWRVYLSDSTPSTDFPALLDDLARTLSSYDGSHALVGVLDGAMITCETLVAHQLPVCALVLVSPNHSDGDGLVPLAGELITRYPALAVLVVTGGSEDPAGIDSSAGQLWQRLSVLSGMPDRIALINLSAPPLSPGSGLDGAVSDWLRRQLCC